MSSNPHTAATGGAAAAAPGLLLPAPQVPALEELPRLAELLSSGSDAEQLEAASLIRCFVSVAAAERDLRVDALVSANAVTLLVEPLVRAADQRLQAEVLGAIELTACAARGSAACIAAQVPAVLVNLTRLPAVQGCADAAEKIAGALASIAVLAHGRAACIAAGAPEALAAIAVLPTAHNSVELVSKIARALKTLSEGDGYDSCISAGVPTALVALARLPVVKSSAVSADQVALAFANLARGNVGAAACVAASAPTALVALASYQAAEGVTNNFGSIDSALGCIASRNYGRAAVSAAVLGHLGLPVLVSDAKKRIALRTLLQSSRGVLRTGACEAIANILSYAQTRDSQSHVQSVIDAGLIPLLIELASKNWTESQFFACRALALAVANGTRVQIAFLIQNSIFDVLLALVCSNRDPLAGIEILAGILRAGDEAAQDESLVGGSNAFLTSEVHATFRPILRRLARDPHPAEPFPARADPSPLVALAQSLRLAYFPTAHCTICLGQSEESSMPFPAGQGHEHGDATACEGCLQRFVETGVTDACSGAATAANLHRCWAWANGCNARLTARDLSAAGVPAALVESFRAALADPERAAAVRRAAAAHGDLRAVFSAEEVDEFAALVRAAPDRWTVCPGCFARIERTGGCDHVVHECAVGVRTDFCFCCGERTTNTRCPTPRKRLLGLITLEPTRAEAVADAIAQLGAADGVAPARAVAIMQQFADEAGVRVAACRAIEVRASSDEGRAACAAAGAPAALAALARNPAVRGSADEALAVARALGAVAASNCGLAACVAAQVPAELAELARQPAVRGSAEAAQQIAQALDKMPRGANIQGARAAAQEPASDALAGKRAGEDGEPAAPNDAGAEEGSAKRRRMS